MAGDVASMSLRLPRELHERLRWVSFQERRPMNAIVTEAVRGILLPGLFDAAELDEGDTCPRD